MRAQATAPRTADESRFILAESQRLTVNCKEKSSAACQLIRSNPASDIGTNHPVRRHDVAVNRLEHRREGRAGGAKRANDCDSTGSLSVEVVKRRAGDAVETAHVWRGQ